MFSNLSTILRIQCLSNLSAISFLSFLKSTTKGFYIGNIAPCTSFPHKTYVNTVEIENGLHKPSNYTLPVHGNLDSNRYRLGSAYAHFIVTFTIMLYATQSYLLKCF